MDRLTKAMSQFCDIERDKRLRRNYEMEREWVRTIMEENGLPCNFMNGMPVSMVRLWLPIPGGQTEMNIDLKGPIEPHVQAFCDRYKEREELTRTMLRGEFGEYEKFFCAQPKCKFHLPLDMVHGAEARVMNEDIGHIEARSRKRLMMRADYDGAYVEVWFCDKCADIVDRSINYMRKEND